MASLYLDNDVAVGLIPILEAAGHTAIASRDLRQGRARDYHQMLVAWERGATIVSHNREDFAEQLEAWLEWPRRWGVPGPEHPGVILPEQCHQTIYGPALVAFLATGHPTTNRAYTWRRRTDT